ncbi:MAG TPA: ATP-binding cassette domain-containing protein [Solirubrobacteraceae bacterium]|nr:ATP-binding cassette domain-containing protein [Solirubrobacteraceae bacterium]
MRPARSPLPWLGGLLALYLLAPLVAFLLRLRHGVSSAPGVGSALATSLLTATISTALIALLGVPLAYLLARARRPHARALEALLALPLALPPLMSGLLLLYVLGPHTAAGRLFDGRLTETRAGIVLAQTFVAAPFLLISARAAFAELDPALDDVAATLGLGRLARFVRVAVQGALVGISAGLLLSWLRAFGEFGATVIVAYHPYSLPVFTFVQFDATGVPATVLPILLALGAAFVVLLVVTLHPPRRARRSRIPATRAPAHESPAQPLRFALRARAGGFELDVAHDARTAHLALLGPSGAGKTFTLRLLAGLAGADHEDVRLGERELHTIAPEKRDIGYVPQSPALMPRRTVWQQVTFGARSRPVVAAWWIERLGLGGLEERFPDELSDGQRRRVALARALAGEPRLLLLDEPLTGLDAPVRRRLRRELRAVQRDAGTSTVIVTHDPEEAALLADEIVLLDHGRVLQAGPRELLFKRPRSPEVAALLGVENTHPGRVLAPGRIASAGVELAAPTGELAVGSEILWRVHPERLHPCEDGTLGAVVTDTMDVGVARELTVALGDELELLLRTSNGFDARVGEPLRLELEAGDVTVWLPEPQGAPGRTAIVHRGRAPLA